MIMTLAVAALLAAQTPQAPDSIRIERLAALGRLWYAARLFHPYLAYRNIDWDGALVAAIPRVRAARTADDYGAAVQGMLDALGDPATRVEHAQTAGQANAADPDPRAHWTDDSVLVISATNYADLEDWSRSITRCDGFAALVPRARAVVFDLRQRVPGSSGGFLSFIFGQSKLLPQLFAAPLAAPGGRTRMHQGYRGDEGTGSGGYWSAWVTIDGDVFSGSPGTAWRPVAFIVNDRSDVPAAALALQAGGRAVLIVEGAPTDASLVSTTQLQIGDGLTVRLRLSELVFADGTGGLPADTVVGTPGAAGSDSSLEAALALVHRPAVTHRARAALEPRAAPAPQRGYAEMTYPSLPYRLLAAFRTWGTFEYFHAYKQLYDDDWSAVLKTFIPRFEGARDSLEYALALAEMVSHTRDNHVRVDSPVLTAYWGEAQTPLLVRVIQGVPVVTGFTNDSMALAAGVKIGDVIERVDGEPAAARMARIERYRTASTPQWLHWAAVRSLLTGPEGSTAVLQIRGASGTSREVQVPRRKAFQPSCYGCRTGPVLRMLPGNVGYADLDRLSVSLVDSMFELFRGTRAIIFDMRGYPRGTAWPIAPRLADRSGVVAARFQNPVATNPLGMSLEQVGEQEMTFTFEQRLDPTTKSRYRGRTVMLIDERTISQAEHTGLFFEAANGTKFVGSPTSGANGDVTSFAVPGGISISFSGHDVRHADGRQLQRVGLKPDVRVQPTIAGIRAGKDEVLDAALAYVRGGVATKR